jgi:hypothetical protein
MRQTQGFQDENAAAWKGFHGHRRRPLGTGMEIPGPELLNPGMKV